MAFHQSPERLWAILTGPARRVVVVHHQNPDGDAVGSNLGLTHVLRPLGHHVTPISPNLIPAYLKWVPGIDGMLDAEAAPEAVQAAIGQADVVITTDFSQLSRCAQVAPWLERRLAAPEVTGLTIDHHIDPHEYTPFLYHDVRAVASCELVYRFWAEGGLTHLLSAQAATCIYLGMMTDSGWLQHGEVSPGFMRILAHLLELGVDFHRFNQHMTGSDRLARLRFKSHCISQCLNVDFDRAITWMPIRLADQQRFEAEPGDTEGLAETGLRLEGVHLSAMFQELSDGRVRCSFRSVGRVSARALAVAFGGGGHFNAAGAKPDLPLEQVVERFLVLVADQQAALLDPFGERG
jgi:phosphoesterase RecJ-like protein